MKPRNTYAYRREQVFPCVLRAAAFAPSGLSLLAARLLRKTAALITPLKPAWS
jgi:hypothetical protein